jgi:hypothetical protein
MARVDLAWCGFCRTIAHSKDVAVAGRVPWSGPEAECSSLPRADRMPESTSEQPSLDFCISSFWPAAASRISDTVHCSRILLRLFLLIVSRGLDLRDLDCQQLLSAGDGCCIVFPRPQAFRFTQGIFNVRQLNEKLPWCFVGDDMRVFLKEQCILFRLLSPHDRIFGFCVSNFIVVYCVCLYQVRHYCRAYMYCP